MMRGSIISHPPVANYVMRHEWQLKALREHENKPLIVNCGAEIMSVITFHYDNPSANKLLTEYIKRARKTHEEFYDHGEWFPYSFNYLTRCLLYAYTRWTIEPALDLLLKINFLSKDVPADIPEFYKSRNTRWYRLNYQAIQKWIDTTYISANKILSTPVKETVPKPDKYTPLVNQICDWHRLVHKKQNTYLYDAKRKALIRKQLKGGRSVYDCAKAVVGNLKSDFYQGRSPRNNKLDGGRVLNCVKHIFKDAQSFEINLDEAVQAKVTDEFIKHEFDKFVKGEKCAFTNNNQEIVIDEKRAKVNTDSYVKFASSVFTFIGNASFDIDNVIELCSENSELNNLMSDISDTEVLTEIVLERMKIYGTLTQNHKDRIAEFCQKIIKEKK